MAEVVKTLAIGWQIPFAGEIETIFNEWKGKPEDAFRIKGNMQSKDSILTISMGGKEMIISAETLMKAISAYVK